MKDQILSYECSDLFRDSAHFHQATKGLLPTHLHGKGWYSAGSLHKEVWLSGHRKMSFQGPRQILQVAFLKYEPTKTSLMGLPEELNDVSSLLLREEGWWVTLSRKNKTKQTQSVLHRDTCRCFFSLFLTVLSFWLLPPPLMSYSINSVLSFIPEKSAAVDQQHDDCWHPTLQFAPSPSCV